MHCSFASIIIEHQTFGTRGLTPKWNEQKAQKDKRAKGAKCGLNSKWDDPPTFYPAVEAGVDFLAHQ